MPDVMPPEPSEHSVLKRALLTLAGASLYLTAAISAATALSVSDPKPLFNKISSARSPQITDRSGHPLTLSYAGADLNESDFLSLHDIPETFKQAVILAEDKRFFEHKGTDWRARAIAVWRRIFAGDDSRGASSLTEQTVRLLHPRPRTLWSKWTEGIEAAALEKAKGKADILEFYLNNVPYANNRRGVAQAAYRYFGRSADTLSPKETLALAVIIRSPSGYDPSLTEGSARLEKAIGALAAKMNAAGMLDDEALRAIRESKPIAVVSPPPAEHADAARFVEHARSQGARQTTLDTRLQITLQKLLEEQLKKLKNKHVRHAAAILADHQSGDVLAWVSIGAGCKESKGTSPGCALDMVSSPRQPGSALKPFLYAAALDKGFSPATLIDDSPYEGRAGKGVHHFRNYSRIYYGKVTLRQALGNSLNIPAVRTLHFVQASRYLTTLRRLGFTSLTRDSSYYDEGLALGVGEVTLQELAAAYSALAEHGVYRPLRIDLNAPRPRGRRIFSEEAASLIGNILSDPKARNLEFGAEGSSAYPPEVAVKTGTSGDYRDAWAAGYNSSYTAAVWFGNADRTPTDGINGSESSARVLRSLFRELTKQRPPAPLFLSRKLRPVEICVPPPTPVVQSDMKSARTEEPVSDCMIRTEYIPTSALLPEQVVSAAQEELPPGNSSYKAINNPENQEELFKILRPQEGLLLASDPRVSRNLQAFRMETSAPPANTNVVWMIDGIRFAGGTDGSLLWPLSPGKHRVKTELVSEKKTIFITKETEFTVK